MSDARRVSPEERRRRGRLLCEGLAADVEAIAPGGPAAWPDAWNVVVGPAAAFVIALSAWECDPTPATLARTRDAYNALVSAWRYVTADQPEARR